MSVSRLNLAIASFFELLEQYKNLDWTLTQECSLHSSILRYLERMTELGGYFDTQTFGEFNRGLVTLMLHSKCLFLAENSKAAGATTGFEEFQAKLELFTVELRCKTCQKISKQSSRHLFCLPMICRRSKPMYLTQIRLKQTLEIVESTTSLMEKYSFPPRI
jgi:hypothetical protein